MMKLVSHAPVDAAADQVEYVKEIVTLPGPFFSKNIWAKCDLTALGVVWGTMRNEKHVIYSGHLKCFN